ncbi:MAG: hypothetical protein F2735_00525 [Actinobacteria bacterium]|uniref:Unannotated protein n=1 Tax=freshwater metagenome TaxID=449393 RepID=A0A6J6WU90_9ZZZZ|nr:hypothetical protein [Actinomycetota bacterium]
MATNWPEGARRLLRALETQGIRYAILHGAEDVMGSETFSDVDTLVDRDPREIVRTLLLDDSIADMRLVMLWPYDFGSYTSFWINGDASKGVQFDMLRDPLGRGRYGLRTDVVLGAVEIASGEPSAEPFVWEPKSILLAHKLTYLLSKRLVKGNHAEAGRISASLDALLGADELKVLTEEVLSKKMKLAVTQFRQGRVPGRSFSLRRLWLARISVRTLRRIFVPVGTKVRLSAETEVLRSVAERFNAILPAAIVVPMTQISWVRATMKSRYPCLVIVAQSPRSREGLLDVNEIAQRITAEMNSSLRHRLLARSESYQWPSG